MEDDYDKKLSSESKQLYGKTRLPHKFCPYCGHKNEARAETCANCGKDISWMKIPDPIPYSEPPKEKPRDLPKQRKSLSRKVMIILLLILLLIIITVVVLVLTLGKGTGGAPMPGVTMRNANLNLEAAVVCGIRGLQPLPAASVAFSPKLE